MATEPGWFYQWFADGWFPPVWFAPADAEHEPEPPKRRGGMSYDQVLSATIGFRQAQEILAERRKKKRRGRRAREREHLLLLAGGWPS